MHNQDRGIAMTKFKRGLKVRSSKRLEHDVTKPDRRIYLDDWIDTIDKHIYILNDKTRGKYEALKQRLKDKKMITGLEQIWCQGLSRYVLIMSSDEAETWSLQ